MGYRDSLFKWVLILPSLVFLSCEVYGDSFRINCGSRRNISINNRVFIADTYASEYLATISNSTIANNYAGNNLGLYQTARVFSGKAEYKFPISQTGRYFIRFYFHPFIYGVHDLSTARFTVIAQQFTLLRDFRPSRFPTIKEYYVNVNSDIEIILNSTSNSVAFLNALEVFLLPNDLIKDNATLVSPRRSYSGLVDVAFETLYRVNMGGPNIVDALWRTWVLDEKFLDNKNFSTSIHNTTVVRYAERGLATRDDAPPDVYGSCRRLKIHVSPVVDFNVSWTFVVDPGFRYFLRFHFCDIVSTSPYELYFNVALDAWVVSSNLDLTYLSNGKLDTPIYLDFVTPVVVHNKIHVSIGPTTDNGNQADAILNGLEIMKMSDIDTLSRPTIPPPLQSSFNNKTRPPQLQSSSKNKTRVIVGTIIGVIVLLVLASLFVVHKRRSVVGEGQSRTSVSVELATGSVTTGSMVSSTSSTLVKHYSFAVIQAATHNFAEDQIIGQGGFGKVYRGNFGEGDVAIKRRHPNSEQDDDEFRVEIEYLTKFRHKNVVTLIGYCDEHQENILVYEYMQEGTLQSHLYGKGKPSLSWEQRLNICIGAAKGLQYIHEGTGKPLIHRDIKSANILLDKGFEAKIGDFGLSRFPVDNKSHVITAGPKGTIGYMDPSSIISGKISHQTDVYSFGVVLLEVLCGRPVVVDKMHITKWVKDNREKSHQFIDVALEGQIKSDCLESYLKVVEDCLVDATEKRPSMLKILIRLDEVLSKTTTSYIPPEAASSSRTEPLISADLTLPALLSKWMLEDASNTSSTRESKGKTPISGAN
ncbi:hypothetical protein SOVF_157490 [Spinacia oleracea]|uniref:Receptor-like protein kinase HERK 1 n=1 Tax=Spinacia oleracea TaxID=3562 RepID=A0ABM3QW51_SPIOL|nr:receptor-like protein kinase HERK 1 [Spinacia oleracea]XP_056687603.1 receptor-like protein kinase HERK 1 [Spinacia oleracea]XP_056687604.1 receptor-like protein kinase HERK 1 [Spinacia oleracea]XP_056687605.1 receptor-like protein kinase HERK 1 [Spinacia oleracea]XP_056687606.1 receptor-like protein kinase HERK 1 [Spinacia oleracea]XP_056687607.1 receptor-like protein kinase HERK 1 [Spinacia oleracea]XP_056687608.1 receptor-like protein kinase HERK 1 [Spinacia oleracea]XP_056687609.1 rec